jgi:hypothetical protein
LQCVFFTFLEISDILAKNLYSMITLKEDESGNYGNTEEIYLETTIKACVFKDLNDYEQKVSPDKEGIQTTVILVHVVIIKGPFIFELIVSHNPEHIKHCNREPVVRFSRKVHSK